MRSDDDIMADYLLKGGKMLSRGCPVCGSPLFQYKDETFCVVCREKGEEEMQKSPEPVPVAPETSVPDVSTGSQQKTSSYATVSEALEETIISLCRRVQDESRPEDCLLLMKAAKKGVEALSRL